MLVHALRAFGQGLAAVPGLDRRWIHAVIRIAGDGTLLTPNPEPLVTVEAPRPGSKRATPRERRGQQRVVPTRTRTRADAPILFADSGDYTLGFGVDSERATRRHEAYLALLAACATATDDPLVRTVQLFHERGEPARLVTPEAPAGEDPWGQTFLFLVDDTEPWGNAEVTGWWANFIGEGTARAGERRPCLVCGQTAAVARIEPEKIRPVPGANTAGAALVSINQPAFEWFGRQQGDVAPICQSCAAAYTRGLNTLVRDSDHRFQVGKGVMVYWAEGGSEQPTVLRRLVDPLDGADEAADIRGELSRLLTGGAGGRVDAARFRSLTLGGNAGRLTIVDWLDVPLDTVLATAQAWNERTRVGTAANSMGIRALAHSLLAPGEDLRATDMSALFRCALLGRPLPAGILARCLQRCRVGMALDDGRFHVTRPQAAVLRLALETDSKEEFAMLDEDRTDPAYVLGRTLALCGQIQWASVGVDRVADRYYGSASTRPGTVYPALLKGASVHLANPDSGTVVWLDRRLQATLKLLDDIPSTLALAEQGRFALGFFHEREHLRSGKRADTTDTPDPALKES